MSSSSSSNNNNAAGNDNHPPNIGIVSPVALAAAAAAVVVPDTDELSLRLAASTFSPQNYNRGNAANAAAAAAAPFSPLATVPPPRTLMSTPYSTTTRTGQNNNNNKNLFDSPLPPSLSTPAENKKVVVLNVGGCQFTTSRSTLCSVQGSQLEAMFSGRHAFCAHQMEDESYFIDRDGR
jgi:hypothetical protein